MAKTNKEVRLINVSVAALMEILSSIYEDGVDYIDIIGTKGKNRDILKFIALYEDESHMEENGSSSPLTETDLNELI